MLREAAIAGIGLAILPRFMTFEAVRRGLLERVLEEFMHREPAGGVTS